MELTNRKLPELLSPAGSLSHLKAAVKAGADAIYMGGAKFGARAYADNFDAREGIDGIGYAHFYGRRVYMTVNTLMKENELEEELYDFLLPYQEAGLDGVIVQDIGTASFIRDAFPDLELHASTQMTITDLHGARAAGRIGMNRIVPARELSLEEIRHIKKLTGLEVEVFIHGALCCSYSGQCLLSSVYGGRSGNRGRCAQPCRLPYQLQTDGKKAGGTAFYLSPRDLCSLSGLPALVRAGVDSLKIEGRMKSEEYVAGVTSIYRKYLDRLKDYTDHQGILVPDPEDRNNLEELYCRTGFTDGYLHRHNGPSMMAMDTPKNTGHPLGRVRSVKKKQVTIELSEELYPKDVLAIFQGHGAEEIVLTVPGNIREITKGGQGHRCVTLNLPVSSGIKPGDRVCRRRKDPLIRSIAKEFLLPEPQKPVKGKITLHAGMKARLETECHGIRTTAEGNPVQTSLNKPVTGQMADAQLRKTGNTPFYFEDLILDVEEQIFLPMSELKQLRRKCFDQLEEKLKAGKPFSLAGSVLQSFEESYRRQVPQPKAFRKKAEPSKENGPEILLTLSDSTLLQYIFSTGEEAQYSVVLPMDFLKEDRILHWKEKLEKAGIVSYLSLPRIMRGRTADRLAAFLNDAEWAGVYAHNINQAQFLYEQGQKAYAGASLYHWNSRTVKEMQRCFPNLMGFTLPVELSFRGIRELLRNVQEPEVELQVFGHIPLMVTAQCIKKNVGKCDRQPEILHLRNPKGKELPVSNHCRECYNIVWSDSPRNLLGIDLSQLPKLPDRISLDLSMMSSGKAKQILDSLKKWEY